MSLWSTPVGPCLELRIPKFVRFSDKALARARQSLEKRLRPYKTKVMARDLEQPVP